MQKLVFYWRLFKAVKACEVNQILDLLQSIHPYFYTLREYRRRDNLAVHISQEYLPDLDAVRQVWYYDENKI